MIIRINRERVVSLPRWVLRAADLLSFSVMVRWRTRWVTVQTWELSQTSTSFIILRIAVYPTECYPYSYRSKMFEIITGRLK